MKYIKFYPKQYTPKFKWNTYRYCKEYRFPVSKVPGQVYFFKTKNQAIHHEGEELQWKDCVSRVWEIEKIIPMRICLKQEIK